MPRSRDAALVLPGLVAVYDGTLTVHASGALADALAALLGLRPSEFPLIAARAAPARSEPEGSEAAASTGPAASALRPRDRAMLGRLAAGATVKELAYERGLSPKTVYARRARAYARLGIATQSELVALATHEGWPELEVASRATLARLCARGAR